jgi:hypothetical protein
MSEVFGGRRMRASARLSKIELRRPHPCVFLFLRTETSVRTQKKDPICAHWQVSKAVFCPKGSMPGGTHLPNPTCRGLQVLKLHRGEKRGEQCGGTKVNWTAGTQMQRLEVASLEGQRPARSRISKLECEIEMPNWKKSKLKASGPGGSPDGMQTGKLFMGGIKMTRMGFVPASRSGANESALSSVVSRNPPSGCSKHSIALNRRSAPCAASAATTGLQGTPPPIFG